MVSAIVLSAGLSTRMNGVNKLLLGYKDKTIIEGVISNIIAAGVEEIIVVTGHQSEKIKMLLQNYPVTIVHNPFYADGMTTSIQQGIKYANGNGYMICLADMIKIDPDEYSLLNKKFEKQLSVNADCITVPRYNNIKGNPVIFSSVYKKKILQHKNMNGCSEIVHANKDNINWVDMPSVNVLKDIDHYADYKNLQTN